GPPAPPARVNECIVALLLLRPRPARLTPEVRGCYHAAMANRKRKPAAEANTYMLRIRMTQADRTLLETAARRKSLDTPTWARSELVGLARKLLSKDPSA